MSYDFWVDINAAGDLGSGCTQDLTPAWSGTVNISGTSVTKVSGPSFPEALLDGNHFIRIDPEGGADATVRILSGGASSLILTEDVGTLTGVTANIGGAFKNAENAVGTSSTTSKIPYADGVGINSDINIWIKAGTYNLSAGLLIQSATQDSKHIRRRILGYNGGFVDGVFSGPVLVGGGNVPLTINAHGITLEGLRLIANSGVTACVSLQTGKYNFAFRRSSMSGGMIGFNCGNGSCSNVVECLFGDHEFGGIIGWNTQALRCVAKRSLTPWGGSLSSYIGCVEYDTTGYLLGAGAYPGAIDFSFCRFTSNKPIAASPGSQFNFSHCIFDHDLDINTNYDDFHFENCMAGGEIIAQSAAMSKYNAYLAFDNFQQNVGIDNGSTLFTPALNLEVHYPDPVLDAQCRYTTAGPREYRFPVEAVGARALRNRQRVSLTEVGL